MQSRFETPQSIKELSRIGREMRDYSEDFGKKYGLGHLKEPGLKILNDLSHVGSMLPTFGATWGTTIKDYSEDDMQLISMFVQGKITNEYLSGLKK
mgnify:CR=1 FL=1